MCRDLGLTANFYFLGYAENSAPLVSMMDIFVLPSLSEGFSNSLLEAMAAKKAVIATDVGGNREALGNNESGILVPPKDAESLAQAITKLLKNENFRYELGKKARERIVRLFTIERMIQTFEDLYETVVMNTEDTLQTS
jgi:glycosyltransferase involved in cell wall biosynthesis